MFSALVHLPLICYIISFHTGVFNLGSFVKKNKMIDPVEVEALREFHKSNGLCSGSECEHIVHKVSLPFHIQTVLFF